MDDQDVDAVNIVDALTARLYIDGPFSDDDTRIAGRVIEHAMRYLLHATQPGPADRSLPYPQTVQAVAGSMNAFLHNLDQLLTQLAQRVEQIADDPRLYADDIGPEPAGGPSLLALRAAAELRVATAPRSGITSPLQRATEALNRLGINGNLPGLTP